MNLTRAKLLNGLLILVILIANPVSAQFQESFSDGEITSNPQWLGDTDEFTVTTDFLLQSNGDTTSATNREIYISTVSESMNNTQWEFFVNPRVSTSSNNRFDVFLSSDLEQLTGNNKGYFVRVGGTPDEVALFRKDGTGSETYVITGVSGAINSSSTNPTKVKVTRDAAGNWTLFADYEGTGSLYELIGTGLDNTYTQSAYFGFVVRYSNSNRQRYEADNIYVGPIIVDNTAPSLVSAKVIDQNTLEVRFSENLDQATAENTENYAANNGLGEPIQATRVAGNFSKVTLVFGADFQNGVNNTLTVTAVEDLAGNDMNPASIDFLYYRAQPLDIVINEILPDPDPAVQLAPVEYVELFNRTPYPINLENWILEANTNKKAIPPITILPDSFLVLTNLAGEEYMYDTVAVAGLESWPALTNTGARITLYNPDTLVMSSVTYTDGWYGNSAKAEGGWSLEQISPYKPCDGQSNWIASEASGGGTPGKRNSVFQNLQDVEQPAIERIIVISTDTIRVFFTESILPETMNDPALYTVSEGVGQANYIELFPPSYKSAKLAFDAQFQTGTIYELSIAASLNDCAGNSFAAEVTGRFAVPETAETGDIVINEVLSNPYDDGVDFVEVYNRSNKVIDLASLQLSKWDTLLDVAEGAELISAEGYLMFPGSYLVLSEDGADVKSRYYTQDPTAFLDMDDFPSYNNDDGIVTLARIVDQVKIDELVYDTELHYALVDNLDGVSLERINPDRPASDRTNWNSAASTAGYATPGYRNSQYSLTADAQAGSITVEPELFSPDGDGFDDVLTISYAFDSPGFTGTINIYDSNGRLVQELVRNQLMGTAGKVSWNGETLDNDKARLGIYVVYLEAFDLAGAGVKIKKACVVGGKL
ncbi:MAG: lamin tail domain-containing protein [Bacteroidia bacterium]